MSKQSWLVLQVGEEVHALPVTAENGIDVVAAGHTVSAFCACRPEIEEHPLGGSRAVHHNDSGWSGANRPKFVQ